MMKPCFVREAVARDCVADDGGGVLNRLRRVGA